MTEPLRITVWNENVHEREQPEIAELYPDGIHGAIINGVQQLLPDASMTAATLEQPEHGLSEATLAETDVLFWWGHRAHDAVDGAIVDRVAQHVLSGMGLVVLHSGHFSRIFIRLMGTTCSLRWRNDGDRETVWSVAPGHPITVGVPDPLVLPEHETYGEFFDVPPPDELVFISSFSGGEVFRSGLTYRRGLGRIFYFSPGDQNYPIYHRADIHRVLANAAEWAKPRVERALPQVSNRPRGWFQDESIAE
ncbi:Trehalose utilization protein [Microbacterium sp. cf046]|uniref:ThuA domain-containing protein n=1 Tax=Microbacterium sp. cf046 TaxID=1761803 RepID=UPI0008E7F8C7|nr:ThuA domain-containing protein [Microbacterium sp. cf046]SFR93056.1 Trehalose utilization protein [Microbacterium sp. cf046]